MSEDKSKQQIPGYQLLDKIGSGAMATVYRAKQVSLDRVVAIKVLSRELTARPGYVDRFYAEGRAAAKLNHPNIVSALDVGEAAGFHYFVMEYIEGETVYDRLMDHVRIDEEDAVRIILQTAKGLEHAHAAGFVHRDVKPQNIMLTAAGVAKLADMGLAQAVDDAAPADAPDQQAKSKARVVFGSPYYISPEQIRSSHNVDFRADIYSLGATFYYLVTGQVPFDAPTPQEVLKKQLNEPLVPARKINSRLTEETDQVIRVCLAKKREDRYDTTHDLVEDLEAIANGEAPLKALIKLGVDPTADDDDAPTPRQSTPQPTAPTPVAEDESPAITAERCFWPAVIGWTLAVIFLVLWIIAMMR